MSSFTSPLVVSPLPDGRRWRLFLPFTYRVGSRYSRHVIQVPAGFKTDFASIPKFLWFLPYWAKFNKSSVLHDHLYQTGGITRKSADLIWLGAMLVEFRHQKHGKIIAYTEYWAVRIFAALAWKERR